MIFAPEWSGIGKRTLFALSRTSWSTSLHHDDNGPPPSSCSVRCSVYIPLVPFSRSCSLLHQENARQKAAVTPCSDRNGCPEQANAAITPQTDKRAATPILRTNNETTPSPTHNCRTTKKLILRPIIKHFGKIGGRSNGAFWTTALIDPGLHTNASMCVARRSSLNGLPSEFVEK
jgi:hypothetical protein